jgi:metallo-beta-lactamase family protein
MEIRFIGPLGCVTGSCAWMRDDRMGVSFLIDCGMQQGEATSAAWNEQAWPFRPNELDFVVLTHPHIDHCGLLPRLYRDGFTGTVYATRETAELATVLLLDSVQHGAPYAKRDVARIHWHEHAGSLLGTPHPVGRNLFVRYFRSAHTVGAVSVGILWGTPGLDQRSIVFSGDLGPDAEDSEVLPLLRHRMTPVASDFAVIESTYGGVVRDPDTNDQQARLARMARLVDRTVESNGVLILPCFALSRTQDVLVDVQRVIASDPARYQFVTVYLDAPMASQMHSVMAKAFIRTEVGGRQGKVRPLWLGKQWFRMLGLDDREPEHIRRAIDIIRMSLALPVDADPSRSSLGNSLAQAWRPRVSRVGDRKRLLEGGLTGPAIVITGGGMCEGGPVVTYLQNLLHRSEVSVGLTGYCAAGSAGRMLQDLGRASLAERRRHTGRLSWQGQPGPRVADIAADIETLNGYSAHADQAGLVDWLFYDFKGEPTAAAPVVFIQHGADGSRASLADAIQARAKSRGHEVRTVMPNDPNAWFDLDRGAAAVVEQAEELRILEEIERLQLRLKRR